jgi:hypothetical protein
MNVELTLADQRDLKAGHSINAAADDGAEVWLFADQFGPPTQPHSSLRGIELEIRAELPGEAA